MFTHSDKLVECVPNFSEGRDEHKISKIASAIRSVSHIKLLHIDSGADANRTVITFVGPPEAALKAAFLAIKCAANIIDMRMHEGEHPCVGATDVCPIIPFANTTEKEAIELSEMLARKVGDELQIPTFLYEKSQPN